MPLRIEVASISYGGADIGNDVRASFTVNGVTHQQSMALSPNKSWRPAAPWVILSDPRAPTAVGSSTDIVIKIVESDWAFDDSGSSVYRFVAPQYSDTNLSVTHAVAVTERTAFGQVTARFAVTFKISCTHRLFDSLWQNHPTTRGIREPCKTNNVPNFTNQCAIRMGLALARSGISLRGYNGSFCWHGHGREHVLRVEELTTWLQGQNTALGNPTTHRSVTNAQFAGQCGVVAFINFWGQGNQGDHIDLWNGVAVRQGQPGYFGRSQRVVFWRL